MRTRELSITAIEEWARELGKLSKRKLDDLIKLRSVFPNLSLSYKILLQYPIYNPLRLI